MQESTAAQAIIPFRYESNVIRTLLQNGEPWFVAKDVCDVLGLDNPSEAIRSLDEDETNTLRISEGIPGRGNPNMNIISESGLYALVFRTGRFRLVRYNGKSHAHTNTIENESFYGFHIHRATERYQELGGREDTYAELTDAYKNFDGALACMFRDCGFPASMKIQMTLFEGV